MEGEGSVFRGLEGIRRWFGELQDLYEYIESEVLEVHDVGERVAIARSSSADEAPAAASCWSGRWLRW